MQKISAIFVILLFSLVYSLKTFSSQDSNQYPKLKQTFRTAQPENHIIILIRKDLEEPPIFIEPASAFFKM